MCFTEPTKPSSGLRLFGVDEAAVHAGDAHRTPAEQC
jgi:hypothetical protein